VIPFDDDEYTPNDPRQELLLWHYQLGHVLMSKLQHMARQGDLPKCLASCPKPECAACRFGHATKVPWRVKGSQGQGQIKVCTQPGQCVSVDQLESTSPSFIAQLKGSLTRARYRYVTVFIDHYSDLSYVHLQKTITSAETVEAKQAFEAYSKSLGIRIQHYHADNGRFADNLFLQSIKDCNQTISFCGVNAHFQNGIAEKRIRDLQESARSQLLHAKHRWPDAVDTSLWPYAIWYANDVHNSTTRVDKLESPIELFSSSKIRPKLKHFHPFACPVYVLMNKLQAGQSIPKWESRSRIGLYLGPLPRHARSVALVLNLATGLVSPQYHLRHDNYFETMKDRANHPSIQWLHKSHFKGNTTEQSIFPPAVQRTTNKILPKSQVPTSQSVIPPSATISETQELQQQQQESPTVTVNEGDPFQPSTALDAPPAVNPTPPPAVTTRSGRVVRPTERSVESQQQRQAGIVAYQVEFEVIDPLLYQEEDRLSALDDPIDFCAYKATSDPDTMYMHEALNQPDAQEFKKAMVKEVQDHTTRNHRIVIDKTDVPKGETILPAVWAMKRKRRIATRQVYKWKARLNLGGHKMIHGKHYDQTYAPALSWPTICLFLILTIINGWKSRQIDFVLAYPQAPVPRPTYMELPAGINFPGLQKNKQCLEILQNVYGGKDAGRTWFLYLKDGLEQLGFQQSQQDDCVFYRGKTIFLVYTDDAIILDPEEAGIDQCIKDLQTTFSVEDEGTIEDYLGVQITKLDDGSFKLAQPQLIDSILRDLGLLDENNEVQANTPKSMPTPALLTKLIGLDPHGEPFNYPWHFRSLIGKLNFLEKSTRADISYPVHQCARFMENPKQSHGIAIKRIGRYLLETRGEGLIIKPDKKHSFTSYVDADFCGNWDKRIAAEDPDTAKSRTGFLNKYASVPIYWQSKLQTNMFCTQLC
jgi:Reverse transcriptase (RNA-dependent DNA polymerase)